MGFIILLALLVRSYHITSPTDGIHIFRQTQTAGLIRDYYRDGIDLFYPRVISLGAPGYIVLEFPLYQAVAALLYKILSPELLWARVLSIFCSLLSIVFIYRITIKFIDQKSAIFASLFFAFMPLNIFYNRVPMPDSMTILFSLIMFDFLIEGIDNKKYILLFIGIVAGCFGLMMKSPNVAPLYLPIIYMTYKRDKNIRSFANIRFLSAFLIPITMMVLWQHHANSVNEMYVSTSKYPEGLYSSIAIRLHPFNTWYFGTLAQRLDPQNYVIILGRIFRDMLSVVGLLFFAVGLYALMKKKLGAFFYIWLFSVLCSMMVIFNLNVIHNFYQLPLTPLLSIFCGIGCAYLHDVVKNKKIALLVTAGLICVYLFMSMKIAKNRFFVLGESDLIAVGQYIDNHTEKDVMIATSMPDSDLWNPMLLYYSDRHGFTVPHKRINNEMITYLRSENIKYLILVDYKGKGDVINKAIAPYKIVDKNNRATIYDISNNQNGQMDTVGTAK